jgi:hypothetical protein
MKFQISWVLSAGEQFAAMAVASSLKPRSGQVLSLSNLRQSYPGREVFSPPARPTHGAVTRR